jgi:hypothetical protein
MALAYFAETHPGASVHPLRPRQRGMWTPANQIAGSFDFRKLALDWRVTRSPAGRGEGGGQKRRGGSQHCIQK